MRVYGYADLEWSVRRDGAPSARAKARFCRDWFPWSATCLTSRDVMARPYCFCGTQKTARRR